MAGQVVRVPQQAWFDDSELELAFPEDWGVRVHRMRGHNLPPMDGAAIRRAFANPIGSKPVRELARGRSQVAIIFEDLARPAKLAGIVPYVLEELAAAGIPDESIRFVAGLGCHGAHTRLDFAKKLGPDIPARFSVFNHNPYENCVPIGTTPRGTPVAINAEVAACDLRIGLGSLVPHPTTGWGGGSKIVLPGICHIDTITLNHRRAVETMAAAIAKGRPEIMPRMGKYAGNELRADIEDAAELARLDVVADVLVNEHRDTVDLVVGAPRPAFAEGARRGEAIYATEPADESCDIVIANTYAKSNEAIIAVYRQLRTWGDRDVDLVVIANAPEGQVPHYLVGSFGNERGGRLYFTRPGLPHGVRRLVVHSQYPEKAASHWFGRPDLIEWEQSWERLIASLAATNRPNPRAAVFPDMTVQYFPQLAE